MSTTTNGSKPACLEAISVQRDDSVLDELRSLGFSAADTPTSYRAIYIDPETFIPVKSVAAYQIGATPLLWFTEDRKEAVVNAAVLSDLQFINVAQRDVSEPFALGKVSELGIGKIAGRELLKFLLFSGTIETYVHIGADLCIVSEKVDGTSYVAQVSGTHTYFTNKKHVEPLHFSFRYTNSGIMTVEPF